MKFNRIYILLLAFAGFACEPDLIDERVKPSSGDLDFSNYIAVGNSLTAGFSDGGLYREAQLVSYPAILASKFSLAGGGAFNQPLLNEGTKGLAYESDGTVITPLFVESFTNGRPDIEKDTLTMAEGTASFAPTTGVTSLNNLGVPGIRVIDIDLPQFSNPGTPAQLNPYFLRMLLGTGKAPGTTYLKVIEDSNPTFFTNWIGNNDVLGYATSGGVEEGTGSPAGTYKGAITPVSVFELKYKALIEALTANGSKGVLITIPNVTDIPYFTTVPYNAVVISSTSANAAATIAQLNGGIAKVNAGIKQWNGGVDLQGFPSSFKQDTLTPYVLDTPHPILVFDEESANTPNMPNSIKLREATTNDLILLTAQSQLGKSIGVSPGAPLPDGFFLNPAEQRRIANAVTAFNNIIRTEARSKGLALWDANAFFADFVKNGFVTPNVRLGASFFTGGAFSLDGVHATPRGYALVAQKILETTARHYSTVLPDVRIQEYRTVNLP